MSAPTAVYAAALRRASTGRSSRIDVLDPGGGRLRRLDAAWYVDLRPGDEGVLARCTDPTLDLGCGPGRLAAALAASGGRTLGVDISRPAVRLARRRGAPATHGCVFDPLPDEGGWRCALLIDGNIGIGGDPTRLLRRCRELVDRTGAVLVEVDPPGVASWRGEVAIRDGGRTSDPFPWAFVNAGTLAGHARDAGLAVLDTWTEAGRCFTHLTRA